MKKTAGYTGHRWTDAELLQFVAMWGDGKSPKEIGQHFKMTERSVNQKVTRLRANGIPLPRRTAGHKPGRNNRPWTSEEIEFLVRRRVERATAEQIATELDRTYCAVNALVCKLRKEGVDVPMYGMGVRRLWDPERLKEAIAQRGLVPEDKRGKRAVGPMLRTVARAA